MSSAQQQRVVLVSGLSGAGKTLALKSLEDMGFEAVDNLPLSLLDALVHDTDSAGKPEALALGIDSRTRAFDPAVFLDKLNAMRGREEIDLSLVYLDAADDVLQRRFTETRRRHPLATDRPIQDGIDQERRLMSDIKDAADFLIDTSSTSGRELRQMLERNFKRRGHGQPSLTVLSFSYRRGLPREADLVFDVRFLRNPHYDPELRPFDGRDEQVAAFILSDPEFEPFFERLADLVLFLLPHYQEEGKSYLTLALGCTGGRHRSVLTAERLARLLENAGFSVTVQHRDVGNDAPARSSSSTSPSSKGWKSGS